MRRLSMSAVVLCLGWLTAGCESPDNRALSGVTVSRKGLKVGDTLPDVTFADRRGKEHRLSAVREDASIIAVYEGPCCKVNGALVKGVQNLRSGVSVVAVSSNPGGCKNHKQCVVTLADPARRIITICDADGAIRRRFGVAGPNRVFAVDRFGKIVAEGTLADLPAIRHKAEAVAAQEEAERNALYSG